MALIKDNVNRVTGLVKVKVPHKLHAGDIIRLSNVEETPIIPDVKDAMAVSSPDGNGYGDAIFDAQNAEYIFDPQ